MRSMLAVMVTLALVGACDSQSKTPDQGGPLAVRPVQAPVVYKPLALGESVHYGGGMQLDMNVTMKNLPAPSPLKLDATYRWVARPMARDNGMLVAADLDIFEYKHRVAMSKVDEQGEMQPTPQVLQPGRVQIADQRLKVERLDGQEVPPSNMASYRQSQTMVFVQAMVMEWIERQLATHPSLIKEHTASWDATACRELNALLTKLVPASVEVGIIAMRASYRGPGKTSRAFGLELDVLLDVPGGELSPITTTLKGDATLSQEDLRLNSLRFGGPLDIRFTSKENGALELGIKGRMSLYVDRALTKSQRPEMPKRPL